MIVNLSEIQNAVVIPMISMAKIEGVQNSTNTLRSLWDATLSIAATPTVDVRAITTAGLYENSPKEASYLKRQKSFRKLNKFSNEWHKAILNRAIKDRIIIPDAYEIKPWDSITQDPYFISSFVKNYGELKNAFHTNINFRKLLEKQADERNILLDKSQIAFWLEEYAVTWGVFCGEISFPLHEKTLRKDTNGTKIILYPDVVDEALIEACRILSKRNKLNLNRDKTYWGNIKHHKVEFTDIALSMK